jgi:hypothetical protein
MTKDGYALVIIVFIVYSLGILSGKELAIQEQLVCVKVKAVKNSFERCFIKE